MVKNTITLHYSYSGLLQRVRFATLPHSNQPLLKNHKEKNRIYIKYEVGIRDRGLVGNLFLYFSIGQRECPLVDFWGGVSISRKLSVSNCETDSEYKITKTAIEEKWSKMLSLL